LLVRCCKPLPGPCHVERRAEPSGCRAKGNHGNGLRLRGCSPVPPSTSSLPQRGNPGRFQVPATPLHPRSKAARQGPRSHLFNWVTCRKLLAQARDVQLLLVQPLRCWQLHCLAKAGVSVAGRRGWWPCRVPLLPQSCHQEATAKPQRNV